MNVVKCAKIVAAWLSVALLSLAALIACGTLEVGIEHTPTPDRAATATVSALATENARLATQVATLAVPTSTPTPSLGKLAYVQGGDIWVKALPDSEPQRLTTDGRNSTPRWSPSGEWLAFRKGDYQVWLMSTDGNSARSLNEGAAVDAFAWAPADDRLAYVAAAGLQVVSADGAVPVTLVPPSLPGHGPGRMGRIAWSPDGAWIACGWQEWQPKQPLTYQGLWRVSSDGEQLAELYASGAPEKGETILAGWSLDGQHILFWQGDILSASMLADGVALYSLSASRGEPTKLVDTVLVHDDFVALAPQGDRLAVTAGGYRATWTNKRVAVVGAGDGELAWVTDESVAAFSPAWSPDGVRLAYAAMPDRGDLVGGEDARLGMMERRVWVVNVQGKPQLQQLTDDPAYRDERPLWSADGSHLLFARMDAEGQASLWLIPAAGGEPWRVVDELTPLPGPAVGWFGYYGYVDWDQLFDWSCGPARAPAGVVVPTLGPSPTARPPVSPIPAPSLPTPQVEAPLSLLYRQGEALYVWDEARGEGRRLLDLPDWAGHLALSPLGYLAYTLDDALYLADLSAGTTREVYSAIGRTAPDWDLHWSADGRVLAYALAYEEREPEAARRAELGTHDGYEQRVVATLTARSGPSPTPPSMLPAPPEPGFANLQLLGLDREAGRILAAPVGGAEGYKAVWAFDAATGQRTTFLTFDEPAAVQGLALSPYLTHLAVTLTPARIAIYDLTTPQVAPRTYDVPTGTHSDSLQWSPDGKWLAFLLYEGEAPGLDTAPARGLWALDVAEMQAYEVIQLESPEAALIGWHPDGKALLVEWLDALSRQRHFQLIDAGSRQVTEFALGEGTQVVGWVRLS